MPTPTVRPPAVAGMFYPGDPRALAAEIDDLLGGVEQSAPRVASAKALVVPDAGYIYSGAVAARAYDDIAPARGIVKRVVLLGPVHRVAVRGLALPAAEFFDTPLGRIPIDQDAVRDRKSTRLNSSHTVISYAVFCLKKKKKKKQTNKNKKLIKSNYRQKIYSKYTLATVVMCDARGNCQILCTAAPVASLRHDTVATD